MLTHKSPTTSASKSPAPQAQPAVSRPAIRSAMPRFLRVPALSSHPFADRRHSALEREAAAHAAPTTHSSAGLSSTRDARPTTWLDRLLVGQSRLGPAGTALPPPVRTPMETRLGKDLSSARVHTDRRAGHLADAIGANAFTVGQDIYFGTGRYQPQTQEGQRLLTHELVHTVQHGAHDTTHADADLAMSLPTALGAFDIDMQDRVAPQRPGLEGHIRFLPDPSGPYSAEIGLIQAVRIEAGGATSGVGSPLGFAGPAESERDILATTGASLETPGWHIDTTYADPAKAQGADISPSYPESVGFSPSDNEHGWLRSPTDIGAASLYDYPGSPRPQISFEFETVAQGMDNQTTYGALHWGFEILAGIPQAEYAFTVATPTREFEISLERFRTYFTHEPVIVYFDNDVDTPNGVEEGKLAEVTTWMALHDDVHLEIEGFADERGRAADNLGLSQRRADNIAGLLLGRGVDPARIDAVRGRGETDTFAAGAEPGQLQANRRVRIRFVRTASEMPSA